MTDKAVKLMLMVFVGMLFSCWPHSADAAKYEYDALNRLTRVVYDNGTAITYTYDKVGNRTRQVSTLQADVSIDGIVNFQDFVILASHWLETNCGYPDEWCEGADIDWSTKVGIEDLAIIAQYWLEGTLNPISGDFNDDSKVDFADFSIFSGQWTATCNAPDWCSGCDFDKSGSVDILDLAEFAQHWLEGT